MKRNYLLLIAIPAYNESRIIGRVLLKIPKKIPRTVKKVLVIDDGSTDNTSKIAKQKGAIVIRHIINRGLGAALQTAFVFAKKVKADILVTMDADGQHNPKDIRQLIQPIVKDQADVVIGSRLLNKSYKSMPVERRIVNLIANIITFFITGIWSSDSQSGFRAFSKKAINKIELITQKMEVSSEIFREIKKNKLIYFEIPIKPVYTEYSISKGQNMINAPNVFLKLLIRLARR